MMQPKIRFNGFSDEWAEKKLGDLYTFSKGKGISKQSLSENKLQQKGIPYGDLFTTYGQVIKSVSTYTQDINGPVSNGSEILVPASSTVSLGPAQVTSIVIPNVRLGGDIIVGSPINKRVDNIFVSISTTSNRHKMYRFISGSTIFHISSTGVSQIPINIPSLLEQQKIGALFSTYDSLIETREAKLAELESLKKGMLQQMFDDGVATSHKPQVRFSSFSDEWVEQKLDDILKERKVTQPQSIDAPLVSFTVENGVTPKTDRYDREGLVTGNKDAKKYKLTLLNDIVYNPANLKFGAISRNKFGKAVFSPIYITYVQKINNLDMLFIEMIVTSDSFVKRARKYEQGTVYERQSVSSGDMLKTVVQLPTFPEQQKIGSLFEKLDMAISIEQSKINQLKEQKKGLLESLI